MGSPAIARRATGGGEHRRRHTRQQEVTAQRGTKKKHVNYVKHAQRDCGLGWQAGSQGQWDQSVSAQEDPAACRHHPQRTDHRRSLVSSPAHHNDFSKFTRRRSMNLHSCTDTHCTKTGIFWNQSYTVDVRSYCYTNLQYNLL